MLQKYCVNGDCKSVAEYLENYDTTRADQKTIINASLNIACHKGYADIAELLIKCGTDNCQSAMKFVSNAKVCKVLIDSKADIDNININRTMDADDVDMCKLIIDARHNHIILLNRALMDGASKITKYITETYKISIDFAIACVLGIESYINTHIYYNTNILKSCIRVAASKGNIQVLNILVPYYKALCIGCISTYEPHDSKIDELAIDFMCRHGRLEALKQFITTIDKTEIEYISGFKEACYNNNACIVDVLLEYDVE